MKLQRKTPQNTLKISIVSVLARPNKHHRRSLDITLRVSLPKYQPISIREDGSQVFSLGCCGNKCLQMSAMQLIQLQLHSALTKGSQTHHVPCEPTSLHCLRSSFLGSHSGVAHPAQITCWKLRCNDSSLSLHTTKKTTRFTDTHLHVLQVQVLCTNVSIHLKHLIELPHLQNIGLTTWLD